MKRIAAKIGTHSQQSVYVRGRVVLRKGDRVEFRSRSDEKWQHGLVDDIKDVGYPLYFISLL